MAPEPAQLQTALGVHSEAGRLRRVLLHRPGRELGRLTPQTMHALLYDDLPWPERAAEEHDAFAATLRARGVEVLLLEELLADVCSDPAHRDRLVAAAARDCEPSLATPLVDHLGALDGPGLAGALLAGVTCVDLELPARSLVRAVDDPEALALAPAANAMFTRDTSVWVGERLELCHMHTAARRREEPLLAAAWQHPALAGAPERIGLRAAGVEGGDVLVAGPGVVVVGMSERTSPAAVDAFAAELREADAAQVVLAVDVPRERASMHLDTLLSFVAHDKLVAHPAAAALPVWRLDAGGAAVVPGGLAPALTAALDRPVELIAVAPRGPAAERAQWADAHNVLAVEPGVVIAYDRTPRANARLREAGIEVLEVPGGELGRGRGGPRCLSCPVARDA